MIQTHNSNDVEFPGKALVVGPDTVTGMTVIGEFGVCVLVQNSLEFKEASSSGKVNRSPIEKSASFCKQTKHKKLYDR